MKDRSQILKSKSTQFIQKEKLIKKDIGEKNYEIFKKLSNLKSHYTNIFSDNISNNNNNSRNQSRINNSISKRTNNHEVFKGRLNKKKKKNFDSTKTIDNLQPCKESYFSFKSPAKESFISFKNIEENNIENETNNNNEISSTYNSMGNNTNPNEDKNNNNPCIVSIRHKNGSKSIFSDLEINNKENNKESNRERDSKNNTFRNHNNVNISILSNGNGNGTGSGFINNKEKEYYSINNGNALNETSRKVVFSKNNFNSSKIETGKSLILPNIDLNNKFLKEKQRDFSRHHRGLKSPAGPVKALSPVNPNILSPRKNKDSVSSPSPIGLFKGNKKFLKKNNLEKSYNNLDINLNNN